MTSDTSEENSRKPLVVLLALIGILLTGSYYLYFAPPAGPRLRPVYRTEGQVFFQGRQLAGAQVVLLPDEESADFYRPSATTDSDGRFRLSTYRHEDGAPAGRYKVGILCPGDNSSAGSTLVRVSAGKGEGGPAAQPLPLQAPVEKDLLNNRYVDPRTSGLQAEVKAQAVNSLQPFNLE